MLCVTCVSCVVYCVVCLAVTCMVYYMHDVFYLCFDVSFTVSCLLLWFVWCITPMLCFCVVCVVYYAMCLGVACMV